MQFRFKFSSVLDLYKNRMHLSFAIVKPYKIRTLTIFVQYVCYKMVGYSTTRGYTNSWTGRLADWTSRRLVNSRTGHLADATGDIACLVFVLLAASASPRLVQSASWQSASWQSASWQSASWPVTKQYMAIMYR